MKKIIIAYFILLSVPCFSDKTFSEISGEYTITTGQLFSGEKEDDLKTLSCLYCWFFDGTLGRFSALNPKSKIIGNLNGGTLEYKYNVFYSNDSIKTTLVNGVIVPGTGLITFTIKYKFKVYSIGSLFYYETNINNDVNTFRLNQTWTDTTNTVFNDQNITTCGPMIILRRWNQWADYCNILNGSSQSYDSRIGPITVNGDIISLTLSNINVLFQSPWSFVSAFPYGTEIRNQEVLNNANFDNGSISLKFYNGTSQGIAYCWK